MAPIIWHLYGFYLRPGRSYFGAKKGCEPLHIQYPYDDGSVVVVNSHRQDFQNLTASAEVYNLDLSKKFSKTIKFDCKADVSDRMFKIPSVDGLRDTYFIGLVLTNAKGEAVSNNFYWLPRQSDVLDSPQALCWLLQ